MSKDKEFVKRWLEALRSGDYNQTQIYLRDKAGFCCLGVACDISGFDSWEETDIGIDYTYRGAISFPSDEVMGLTGLPYTFLIGLTRMNDSGKSFTEIADYIEVSIESGAAYE